MRRPGRFRLGQFGHASQAAVTGMTAVPLLVHYTTTLYNILAGFSHRTIEVSMSYHHIIISWPGRRRLRRQTSFRVSRSIDLLARCDVCEHIRVDGSRTRINHYRFIAPHRQRIHDTHYTAHPDIHLWPLMSCGRVERRPHRLQR